MRVVGRGYVDAVRNLEVAFRSLGGGSKEKMQEDWESIDLKSVYSASVLFREIMGRPSAPRVRSYRSTCIDEV